MELSVNIDPFGYYWKDNNEDFISYDWVDINNDNFTLTFSNNDEAANEIINFPFDFPFYGNNYSSCIVNANGWIGFGDDNNTWENTELPNIEAPQNAIFPFWDDLNPINDGNSSNMDGYVRYYMNDSKIVIWFDSVRRWTGNSNMDGYFDFQVILYPNGVIDFNYRNMEGNTDSATIGIQNEIGSSGITVSINQNFIEDYQTIRFKGQPQWLSISPLTLNLESGEMDNINLFFNTELLSEGFFDYTLNLKTNDFNSPNIEIPITLIVDSLVCNGSQLGDLNEDQAWNVLDVILMVNIILYNTNDECDFYLADVNEDEIINVLDVISVINIILDQ